MAQAHADADDLGVPALYSVRTPDDVYFADEWRALAEASAPLQLSLVYSRRTPDGWTMPPGRITRDALSAAVIPAAERPRVYVCGSTSSSSSSRSWLVELGAGPGHPHRTIRRHVMTGHLDGNALAGPLADFFSFDITTTTGRWRNGTVAEFAGRWSTSAAPARSLRCATDNVLAVFVDAGDRAWIDLAGVSSIEVRR